MIDIKDINNNIRSNRWKARYDKLPDEIKVKLDALADADFNEYQLKVIKRKRVYPEIGDIFRICPCGNVEYYGIVVNNHVNNNNGENLIVVFIFKSGVDIKESVSNGIKKEDLLIDPK